MCKHPLIPHIILIYCYIFKVKKLKIHDFKNLLKLITDKCFEKDIGVCALTSEEFSIPRNSVHDRLNYLKNNYALDLEKQGYETLSLGENIFAVMKGEAENRKETYFVNGQTVVVKDNGKKK